MPALKVIGLCGTGRKLTTRPFAGDDLHVLCVLAATYRMIQMACIIPFWIRLVLYRLHGTYVSVRVCIIHYLFVRTVHAQAVGFLFMRQFNFISSRYK